MKLHADTPGMCPVAQLFNDTVGIAPGLGKKAIAQPLHGLVVAAVDRVKSAEGRNIAGMAQWLYFVIPLSGFGVSREIKEEGPAERHVEHLVTTTDGQDGPARADEGRHRGKLPLIARLIGPAD